MADTFNTIPQTLKNGTETVRRADGAVWLDQSKGLQGEKPGWFFQGGVRAPDSTDLNWHQLKNGAMSVRRADGGVWMDESKGFTEAPGWYGKDGARLQDSLQEAQPQKGMGTKIAENLLFNPVVQGLSDIPAKGLQLAARIPGVPQSARAWVDAQVRGREEAYSQLPMNQSKLAGVNRAVAGALPMLAVPAPAAATLLGKMGTGAAEGAAAGMLQPVVLQPGQEDQFAGETLKQGAVGASLGGAVPGVAKVAGMTLGAARKGLQRALVGKVNPQAAAEVQALGDRFGVRLSAGDITGNPGTQKAEVALENLPFGGMGAFRKAQDAEAQAAAKKAAENLHQGMLKQGFDTLSQVQKVAKEGGKRGGAAQKLLAAVDAAGDDWKLVLQTSGNMKLFGAKLKADQAYRRVEDLSAAHGEVPLLNTMRAIEEAKRELSASALPDEATAKLIATLDRNLNREAAQGVEATAQQAVGAEGVTVASALPPQSAVDTSYSGMRSLRGSLGSKISDYYTGKNSVVGKEGVGALERIKGAIERDMDEFAQSNGPELREAWKEADSLYKNTVAPFKDRALATALADESPEKMARFFLSKGDGYTKGRIFQALDPKGQAALKSGLLQEALDAGTNAEKGLQAATFSPARFAGFIERNQDALKTAFKGEDKWALDGLGKLMRHVERAGQFAENPPTGNRMAQLAVGGGLLELGRINPVAAVSTWLTAKGLQQLYTTSAGKRLLLAASDLQPGSPAMQKLLTQLPKLAGTSAGQPATSTPEPNEATQ